MVLIALILAAAPADAVADNRRAYAACLDSYTSGAIGKSMAKDAFIAGLKAKCADKEASFRQALTAADKADGMSEAEAKEDADDQVGGYVDQMVEKFQTGE